MGLLVGGSDPGAPEPVVVPAVDRSTLMRDLFPLLPPPNAAPPGGRVSRGAVQPPPLPPPQPAIYNLLVGIATHVVALHKRFGVMESSFAQVAAGCSSASGEGTRLDESQDILKGKKKEKGRRVGRPRGDGRAGD